MKNVRAADFRTEATARRLHGRYQLPCNRAEIACGAVPHITARTAQSLMCGCAAPLRAGTAQTRQGMEKRSTSAMGFRKPILEKWPRRLD